MSVFNLFKDKVQQLAIESDVDSLPKIAQSYRQQIDEANQFLRDKQAVERQAHQSNRSSVESTSFS